MPQKSSTFAFQYSFLFVMKVLQLGKFYPIEGGVEKTMFDLLTGLASKGVQCDMLCANAEKGRKETKLSENSRLICTQTLVKRYATMISLWHFRRSPSDGIGLVVAGQVVHFQEHQSCVVFCDALTVTVFP